MRKSSAVQAEEPKPRRRGGPRTPSQERGLLRFKALLDATEDLLQSNDPDAIGLYQIAERANVPAPSVYHFFPTKEAAYDALAERFVGQLLEVHNAPIEARRLDNWTDLFRIDIDRGRDFYNRHPPALKIFYGGYGGVNAKNIDRIAADKISTTNYERMNRIFHMPVLRDAERLFEVRLGILDAVWTISVRRHGHITQDYQEEAYEACLAYSRIYLPARIEQRDVLRQAAERGESLTLPFDTRMDAPAD